MLLCIWPGNFDPPILSPLMTFLEQGKQPPKTVLISFCIGGGIKKKGAFHTFFDGTALILTVGFCITFAMDLGDYRYFAANCFDIAIR